MNDYVKQFLFSFQMVDKRDEYRIYHSLFVKAKIKTLKKIEKKRIKEEQIQTIKKLKKRNENT